MLCCINCFTSPSLKDFIESEGSFTKCDFCSSRNVKGIKVRDLYDLFEAIFNVYREIEYGRDYYKGSDPHDHGEFLFDLINEDWYWIFSDNFDDDMKDEFWEALTSSDFFDKDNPPIDSTSLWKWDESVFEESWDYLSDYLKTERRFTITDESIKRFTDFLPELIENIKSDIPSGKVYYRARLGPDKGLSPFPCAEMGSPPPEKTIGGGRANPPGIPFLYLSDDDKTAIIEARPWKSAIVSVAKFETVKKIRVVDLTADISIDDPFVYGNDLHYVLNNSALIRQLGDELSKPINPQTKNIEYVPTQYLTEIFRNLNCDGMIYPSALGKKKNIVLFTDDLVECKDVNRYKVDVEVSIAIEDL